MTGALPHKGTIYGVGLGPGDPDLMSVKADRIIRSATHIAFFRKAGRKGQARSIVDGMLSKNAIEFAMEYPVTTEIPVADPRYNQMLCFLSRLRGAYSGAVGCGSQCLCSL